MTLDERITYCHQLAEAADTVPQCDAYIAEMAGLMALPLSASLEAYRPYYVMGARDRQILLDLEARDAAEAVRTKKPLASQYGSSMVEV